MSVSHSTEPEVDPEQERIEIDNHLEIYQKPSIWRQLWSLRNIFIVILTPIHFLPLAVLFDDQKLRCFYVILVMGVLWLTEAVPISATSLIPFFMFPMAGIITAKTATATYMNDTSMLFFGGLIVAVAIETWNLHKRIALRVLMLVGTKPKWLMAGLMLVTWFLSMWISNTATTGMMIPIVQGVLQQLKATSGQSTSGHDSENCCHETFEGNNEIELEEDQTVSSDVSNGQIDGNRFDKDHEKEIGSSVVKSTKEHEKHLRMCKALSLCICYSANIGGIASLTGTGPNLVLKGQTDIVFQTYNSTSPITFASFLVFGFPLSFLVLLLLWIWMQIYFRLGDFCSCFTGSTTKDNNSRVTSAIRDEYRKLGPVTYAEKSIMAMFGSLVLLWITRDLGSVGGWGNIFRSNFVTDSTAALLMAFLLFICPSKRPNIFCFRDNNDKSAPVIKPLVTWSDVHEIMPWSVFLILGAGYCLATASAESGLSSWVGNKLQIFADLDSYLLLLILLYIMCFATEVTSNVATATLMMPIMAQLAISLKMNPLFFMFPTALTISFAFMMPVATPPNAIVFSYGNIRVLDMVGCGFMMNILSVPLVLLATATWGNAFFNLETLPSAFLSDGGDLNATTAI